MIRTNLQGPYFLTQAIARDMVERRRADASFRARDRLRHVGVGGDGVVNRGEYCVSKAGLAMTAKLFAVRLAADGIPVYEVRPGIIATDMTAGVKQVYDDRIAGGLVPEHRWGQPDDVGRAWPPWSAGICPTRPEASSTWTAASRFPGSKRQPPFRARLPHRVQRPAR